MVKNVLLLIASIIFSLFIAEAAFRVIGLRGNYQAPCRNVTFNVAPGTTEMPLNGFFPNSINRSYYPDNPRGYFDNQNILDHHFNSAGYRDIEHSISKPASTYRILGLGDSYLYGQGVKFDDICLTKLGKNLQEKSLHKKIETINTGMCAYNTGHERDLLVNRGLVYDPDMVIVHFVLNDVEEDLKIEGPKMEFYHDYLSIYQKADTLSQYSYLWGWSRQQYLRSVVGRRYIEYIIKNYQKDSSKFQSCWKELLEIQKVCEKNNIKLLVVIFPFFYNLNSNYPFQIIHDQLKKSCVTANIPVLDLLPYFKAYRGPELWVHPVDQHPNEVAHDIAAKAMSKYLLENMNTFNLPLQN